MTRFKWMVLFALILCISLGTVLLVSCGDDDDDDDSADLAYDDDNDTDDDDSGDDDDDDTDDDDDDDDDDDIDPTACYEITFNLHSASAGWVYITLDNMKANLSEVPDYDFKIGHIAKEEDIDYILLGPDAWAQNMGNTDSFDDVATVPTEGYLQDEGETYVIGTSWQEGGSCPAGWDCTDNIYAFKLADGNYAKFTVVSAQAGDFVFHAFKQGDGSDNVSCSWPE